MHPGAAIDMRWIFIRQQEDTYVHWSFSFAAHPSSGEGLGNGSLALGTCNVTLSKCEYAFEPTLPRPIPVQPVPSLTVRLALHGYHYRVQWPPPPRGCIPPGTVAQ